MRLAGISTSRERASQSEVYEEIERVGERLKNVEGVIGVILFGSYSREEYGEGSDIDLLIVFRNKKALNKNQREIYGITAETAMFFQAIVLTLNELKNSTLFEPALREGKIHHAKRELKRLFTPIHRPYAITILALLQRSSFSFSHATRYYH